MMKAGVRSLYAASLLCIGLLAGRECRGQANGNRLHRIDLSAQSARTGSGATESLAKTILDDPYDADLAAIPDLPARIAASQASYLDREAARAANDHALTDIDLAVAFGAWRSLVADPDKTPVSPLAVHVLRASLATVAPSIISTDTEGHTALTMSPAEAVYLFDFLIAHGGVPGINSSAPRARAAAYNAAVDAYFARVDERQRQADISRLINTYLLR